MKETSNNIDSERIAVDNYIITTCITLLGAFIIFFSIKKPENLYIAYSSIISICSIIISLLASLWHKSRYPKRLAYFEKKSYDLIQDISGDIADFAENILIPFSKPQIEEDIKSNLPSKKKTLRDYAKSSDIEDTAKKIIVTHLEKLYFKMGELNQKAFKQPLDEKNAKLFFYIDIFSLKTIYVMFIIGITFFLISLILKIL